VGTDARFFRWRSIMHNGQPIDPATHIFCVRLAWALVSRIQSVLRPEELNDCARQFYLDIREHLDQDKKTTT
jgi:hypothetical protein